MNSRAPKSDLEKRLEGMTPAEQIKALIEEVGECRKIIAEIKNPVRHEMEKLTDFSKKNTDPDEELDDIVSKDILEDYRNIAEDYRNRTFKLSKLCRDNFKRAEAKMVVEDSPVEYAAYKFISSIQLCDYKVLHLRIQFSRVHYIYGMALQMDADIAESKDFSDIIKWYKKWIKDFHSLEEELSSQNKFLEFN